MMVSDKRAHLEAEANATRARLSETLDVLDRRRHLLTDVVPRLQRHARGLVWTLALALVVAGGAFALVRLSRARARRLAAPSRAALSRAPMAPQIVRVERRSFVSEIARRVLLGLVSSAALALARRGVILALPAART